MHVMWWMPSSFIDWLGAPRGAGARSGGGREGRRGGERALVREPLARAAGPPEARAHEQPLRPVVRRKDLGAQDADALGGGALGDPRDEARADPTALPRVEHAHGDLGGV